jgi:hypothetical protein
MKHHFIGTPSSRYRQWQMVPNMERHKYWLAADPSRDSTTTIVTIGKRTPAWERIFDMPMLEEVTIHEGTLAQMESIHRVSGLKRLRIAQSRPKSLENLTELSAVSELVLEYVSGFEDIAPVGHMPALRDLHLENLRRVHDFSPLAAAIELRQLHVSGTFDWNQKIDSIGFLGHLIKLEELDIYTIPKAEAANLPDLLALLPKLKAFGTVMNQLPIEVFAEIEARFPHVDGAIQDPVQINVQPPNPLAEDDPRRSLSAEELYFEHPTVYTDHKGVLVEALDDYGVYFFLGAGKGMTYRTSKGADEKAKRGRADYAALVAAAKSRLR